MTLKEAFDYSFSFLSANGIDESDFKALTVCCHIAGIRNSEYHFNKEQIISDKKLDDCLFRLKSGEPLQYIIGKWDFYDSEFYVGEGVLIPRPETEELVELAIKNLKNVNNPIVIDLCSGTGCIGISIAKALADSKVYCIEKSKKAYSYLLKNANGVDNVVPINDDIFNDIDIEKVDLIISNPPYIKSCDIQNLQDEVKREPAMALDGGVDGLDFYRVINDKWFGYIKKNGLLLLEIGNDQGSDILEVLTNFRDVEVKKDLYGNDRMVVARG